MTFENLDERVSVITEEQIMYNEDVGVELEQ
jgi:pantocin A family RiPP